MHLNVILPLALDREFLYSPGGFDVQVGNLVEVDFNGKKLIGLVASMVPERCVQYTVKEITTVLPIKPLPALYVEFLFWVARYNFTKIGLVLRSALVREIPDNSLYCLNGVPIGKAQLTPTIRRALELLHRDKCLTLAELQEAKIHKKTIQKLLEIGAIKPAEEAVKKTTISNGVLAELKFELSEEQGIAKEKISLEGFVVHLLDGVTGSGKTAVYLSAALEILKREEDAQIMIIFSEIALASYIFERVKSYFQGTVEVIEWHSGLSPSRRGKNWLRVVNNKARVIVGARSAVFLPAPNLRMIIVDEEHDQSFKQDHGDFTYNARDLAIMRAKLFDIPALLSSATPSLESFYNVQEKGFIHLSLENRFGGAQLPNVKVVDMRAAAKASSHISLELYEDLKRNAEAGMQSLLFLNKRGYASIVICSSCGHKVKCPDCVAWLVEHRWNNTLLCHLCGFKRPMITECEQCASEAIIPFGPGVEKISEEIEELFPGRRIIVMSSDTKLVENIRKIEEDKVDIIIGTQIISKGYDFPKLTLLAIIDSDASVYAGDLRSSEKNFQVLQQAIGRVGRRKIHPGSVVLQSYSPDNAVVEALKNNDRQAFYDEELKMRQNENMPPFNRLVGIVLSGLVEAEVSAQAREAARLIAPIREIAIFGPCPAPIGVKKNRFRYRILLILPKNSSVHRALRNSLAQLAPRKGVNVQVDVDPLCFL